MVLDIVLVVCVSDVVVLELILLATETALGLGSELVVLLKHNSCQLVQLNILHG